MLSKTISTYGINATIYRNGRLITKNSDIEFEGDSLFSFIRVLPNLPKCLGMSGLIRLGPDGVRDSTYSVFGYNDDGKKTQYLSFETSDTGIVSYNIMEIIRSEGFCRRLPNTTPTQVPPFGPTTGASCRFRAPRVATMGRDVPWTFSRSTWVTSSPESFLFSHSFLEPFMAFFTFSGKFFASKPGPPITVFL